MSLRDPSLNGNPPPHYRLAYLDKLTEKIGYKEERRDRLVHLYLDIIGEVGEVGSHTEVGDGEEGVGDGEEGDSDEIFCDSEYDVGSDSEDEEGGNTECDNGVEGSAREDEGDNLEESSGEGEGELSNSEGELSNFEDFNSDKDSDEGDGPKYPVFSDIETFDPRFEIGMLFSSKKEVRNAIHSHAVKTRRNIKITKNDKRRLYARCVEEGCDWKLHALVIGDKSTFQIRDYNDKHDCGANYHAYRAKWNALKKIEGLSMDQYGMLWDYVEELRRSNPGSTFILSRVASDGSGGSKFGKLYVCFEGLKMGFLAGCRKIIGVDGCHLKGPHGGVMLTAVGIDPNNDSFPIAYAVVGGETRETWEWFLTLLRNDLNIHRDSDCTFMSDKQKGLILAFETVFPTAENRFCVRHLHANMKRVGFKGLSYKKVLWKAARATTVTEFEARRKEICKLDIKMGEWLNDKPPHQWSKSHFSTLPRCDILLNNLCESFNSNILEAREKQIYTMLEMVREFLMVRLQTKRDRARRRWKGKVCPKIKKILARNLDKASSDCIPIKASDIHFEISCFDGSRCTVDLEKHSCSCRKWDLSGIPCKHAMSALSSQMLDGEDFVDCCYHVQTYLRVYDPCIYPVNGPEKWNKTNIEPLLPPNPGRQVGRPARARRLEVDERPRKTKKGITVKGIRLKRQQQTLKCRFCGEPGHNKKGCQMRKDAEALIRNEEMEDTENTQNQSQSQTETSFK
ncbi:UNVERIFIED_CONTAM: hypothetical protein Sradi_6419400 [Sesamum radiatum]|uniref:SWIM-type domain-containing protein n=1 Tax=Sesamum radiatum TaxID=300843 RepID=A0AAW2K3W1_SESRA